MVGLLAVVLVLALAGAGLWAWRSIQRSPYEQAVAAMPDEILRATYTDWQQVRAMARGTTLDADATPERVEDFVLRAYDQDLTSTSAVVDSTFAMWDEFGFSPLNASWEMYGQSRKGAVVAMRLPESVDPGVVESNLRGLGYDAPPDGAGSGGVWAGSADLVAQIDPSLTPVLQNLVVLPEERLVLMSDSPDYAESSAAVLRGDAPSLEGDTEGVEDLAELTEDPVSAVLYASDFACENLGTASTDAEDRALADRLVEDAGGVSPLAGLVLALGADHGLRVGMYFETPEQAEENLAPRAELASGEAVGQGGMFSDRFRVSSGEQSDHTVVLDLTPVGPPAQRDESFLLSDLSAGPLLFAAC